MWAIYCSQATPFCLSLEIFHRYSSKYFSINWTNNHSNDSFPNWKITLHVPLIPELPPAPQCAENVLLPIPPPGLQLTSYVLWISIITPSKIRFTPKLPPANLGSYLAQISTTYVFSPYFLGSDIPQCGSEPTLPLQGQTKCRCHPQVSSWRLWVKTKKRKIDEIRFTCMILYQLSCRSRLVQLKI